MRKVGSFAFLCVTLAALRLGVRVFLLFLQRFPFLEIKKPLSFARRHQRRKCGKRHLHTATRGKNRMRLGNHTRLNNSAELPKN
jgi:hypothetical protein